MIKTIPQEIKATTDFTDKGFVNREFEFQLLHHLMHNFYHPSQLAACFGENNPIVHVTRIDSFNSSHEPKYSKCQLKLSLEAEVASILGKRIISY